MKFLALETDTPGARDERCTPDLLRAEARRVYELQQADLIRELYFRAERHAAVLLLECADEAAARAALDSLPLVQAGLIQFELIGLRPYSGLARLFAS